MTDDGHFAEVIAIYTQLPLHGRKVMTWLGRLYLERQVQPSARVDAEIKMIEMAIENGYADQLDPPSVIRH
jgi:hypothetical protein